MGRFRSKLLNISHNASQEISVQTINNAPNALIKETKNRLQVKEIFICYFMALMIVLYFRYHV